MLSLFARYVGTGFRVRQPDCRHNSPTEPPSDSISVPLGRRQSAPVVWLRQIVDTVEGVPVRSITCVCVMVSPTDAPSNAILHL